MRKSILIGVLAALMLFAFTACEPQTITWPTERNISFVAVEQAATYIVGEKAEDTGFNIVINYTEGEPTVIPGAGNIKLEGGMASVDGITFKNGENVVPAVPCKIEYKTVTSATITGVSNVTIEDGAKLEDVDLASKINLDGAENLTLTLAFDGGERVYTADDIVAKSAVTATNGKINVVLSLVDKDGKVLPTNKAVQKGEAYTVTLDNYYLGTDWAYEKNLAKGFETGVAVSVVEEEEIKPDSVKLWIDGEPVSNGNVTVDFNSTSAALKDDMQLVYYVGDEPYYTDDTKETLKTVPATDWFLRNLPETFDEFTSGAQTAIKTSYSYTIEVPKGLEEDASLNITTGTVSVNDPLNVSSVTVDWRDGFKPVVDTKIGNRDIVVTAAKLASGLDAKTSDFTISVVPVQLWEEQVGEEVTVYFSISYKREAITLTSGNSLATATVEAKEE